MDMPAEEEHLVIEFIIEILPGIRRLFNKYFPKPSRWRLVAVMKDALPVTTEWFSTQEIATMALVEPVENIEILYGFKRGSVAYMAVKEEKQTW